MALPRTPGFAAHITHARVGILCCTTSMIILGASVPITRVLMHYPASAGQAMRYGLAAAVLAPIALGARRDRAPIRRQDWWRLAATAAAGLVAFNYLLLAALRHATPTAVAAILGCAPIAMALAAPLLRKTWPGGRVLAAAVVVTAGTMLVNGLHPLPLLGVVVAAGALAADVAFSVLAAPLIPRLGPVTVAAATCALAVPMFGATALLTGETARWRPPEPGETAAVVFLGLALTAGAFVTWFHGLRHLGAAHAGIAIGAVPIAALAVTSLQTDTVPNVLQMAGISAVLTGFWMSRTTTPAITATHLRRPAVIAAIMAILLASTGRASSTHTALPDRPISVHHGLMCLPRTRPFLQRDRRHL